MRIAMIGSRGIPAIYGGIERHIEELSSRLIERGNEVIVYARNYYTEPNCHIFKGIMVRRLPTIKTKHLDNIVHTLLATIDVLFRKVDVVHYHGIGPSLLIFIPFLFGKKTVVTIHSLDWCRKKWKTIAKLSLKIGEFFAVIFAHHLITVSKTLERYMNKKYKRKARYIPNGINPATLTEPSLIKQYGLNKDSYILSVGRLVPEKGFEYLINAFKKVETEKRLVIVGGSGNADSYVNYLKRISDNRILFLGYQHGEILKELFSNAYLFVLPSEEEGLSISLLEAMSYGKRVLTSDIPANKEVVEGFGFTFKNKDANDLSQKLKMLLLNRNSSLNTGKTAQRFVFDNYDWDIAAEDTQKVYESLFIPRQESIFHAAPIQSCKEYLKCQLANLIGSLFYYTHLVDLIRYIRKRTAKKGRLFILFYHSVKKPHNGDIHLCVSPDNFKKQLQYLVKNFKVICLDELLNYLETRTYPKRDSVMITFDDGWEDNYTNAFPLLKKYGVPAIIFLVSGFINKENMLKDYQIREMTENGITFGAHGTTHSRLSLLNIDKARREIFDSKSKIESIINMPVTSFAYPYGLKNDFIYETIRILEEARFSCAFTSLKNHDVSNSSRFLIPRKGMANFSLPAFVSKIEGIFDFHHTLYQLIKREEDEYCNV